MSQTHFTAVIISYACLIICIGSLPNTAVKTECSCQGVKASKAKNQSYNQFCGHELNKLNKNKACQGEKLFECRLKKSGMNLSENTFDNIDIMQCTKDKKCARAPVDQFRRVCLPTKAKANSNCDSSRVTLPVSDEIGVEPEVKTFYKNGQTVLQLCGIEINKLNKNRDCLENDLISFAIDLDTGEFNKEDHRKCRKCSPDPSNKLFRRVCGK